VSTITSGFHSPSGIAVDANGNVFVADATDNVIRKIAKDGSVTSFAGAAGEPGFTDGLGALAHFNQPAALAFDALGNLYVADSGNNAIRRIAPSTLVTTVVPAGSLNAPTGIAFDNAGHLLIADSGNRVIRIATATTPRRRSARH
jgi:DNA-binding beta-propeller fold protein YncE